jgi:hypothetical protein
MAVGRFARRTRFIGRIVRPLPLLPPIASVPTSDNGPVADAKNGRAMAFHAIVWLDSRMARHGDGSRAQPENAGTS